MWILTDTHSALIYSCLYQPIRWEGPVMGVKSIQWTARTYGGQAVTDVADHWFTLTVLLPSTNALEDS